MTSLPCIRITKKKQSLSMAALHKHAKAQQPTNTPKTTKVSSKEKSMAYANPSPVHTLLSVVNATIL